MEATERFERSDMAAQLIPVTNALTNYKLKVSLDGINLILVFSYNDRTQIWDMCVQDSGGNPLVDGIAMVTKYPLNYRFNAGQVAGMPPGIFLLVDQSGKERTPDITNFGQGVSLFYVPVADIQAAT